MSLLKLPPNPEGIRVLTSIESDRLKLNFTDPKKLPPSYKQCITCKGKREFKWYNPNAYGDMDPFGIYECPCVEQWVMHRYFLYNGIGLNLMRIGWMHCYADRDAKRAVQDYLVDRNLDWNLENGTGLYMYGPRGTGKSLMASIFLRRTLALGHTGHWTTFIEMREAYTNAWKDKDKATWFNLKIRGTGVLVIDDPGREMKSGNSVELSRTVLDDVIRHRMAGGLPTIITSNETPDSFRQLYGGNVDSLIQERMIPVPVPGDDYRPKMRPDALKERDQGLTRPIVIQ